MNPLKVERYAAYKDSGVEWLGEVPAHWEIKRLKDNLKFFHGYAFTDEDYADCVTNNYLVKITEIKNEKVDLSKAKVELIVTDKISKYKINKGDLLIALSGATSGKVGFFDLDETCYLNQRVARINADRKINLSFVFYLLNRAATVEQMYVMSNITAQPNFNNNILFICFAFPQLTEQTAIAAYLDSKTAQIDRQIDLLSQKATQYGKLKQSLINETVTRGLDKSVPMKDSGVEWIDKIPSTWALLHLKNCVSTKITDGPHATPIFIDGGVPFLSAEAVQDGCLNFSAKRGYISEADDKIYSLKCKPKKHDIFIVKSGSTTGKVGYVSTDDNFNIWSPLALVRSGKDFDSRYVYLFLSSSFFQKQVQMFWSFGTQPNIGMSVIEALQIAVPPLAKQTAIAAYLNTKTAQIDRIVTTINQQINKLKDLRKALINDVITGKIKVSYP